MPKGEKGEFLKILGVDTCSTENEIKRAYKKLALQFHPDKNQNDFSGRKQFEEVSKAFESLTLDYGNESYRQDYDQVFFDFLRDIFGWKEDNEAGNASNFLLYFCGSKQHLCSSDMDYDLRYQETEEEEDIDGESDIDSILEIIKNRKKKGKHVPEEFKEENVLDMKNKLFQHKEDMKKDALKKQTNKKGKTSVPVAKPKPKSKKQLLAEQRRREKEMEQIAMELEEKRKEEEEKEKQRKQLEVEKQKRLEEERIRTQNEERKRREREQKEREKQQKIEQEKEEKRHRQQEEERKRREEEEKRRKAEKEKAEKEKAARKAAQHAAKEKEEKEKAANKSQNMKRQQQQQRTDQQQYPREIPPRFQKKMKQLQQQQQQQQMTQSQPSQQQQQQQPQQQVAKIQPKPPPAVGKKKDPNRFSSKEYADIIEPMDDSGWSQSAPAKGSGWGNAPESWEDSDKWGSVNRQWVSKEGTWDEPVVDGADKDTWPTVGTKGTIGDKFKASCSETNSEKGQHSSESSPKTSVSSMSTFKSDNLSSSHNAVTSSTDKKVPSSNNWQGLYPPSSENWDITDDSIDQAIDAAEAASTKECAGLTANWGGVAQGGLGGLIGTRDSTSSLHVEESKVHEPANNPDSCEPEGWSKTPGKGFKTKALTTNVTVGTSSITSSWGGTPAENAEWTEANTTVNGVSNSLGSKSHLTEAKVAISKPAMDSKVDQNELSMTGWGEAPTSSTTSSTWGGTADITGVSCWDNSAQKSENTELKNCSNSKVSRWLESTGVPFQEMDWGTEGGEPEEGSEGSWDGWTTASKRNRAPKPPANDTNAWMNRSLKQLLDMGFKQEDAERALKANHMNIESAIGDLLTLNMGENREEFQGITVKLREPDPAEAARIQQQQQQNQGKMNRKQRRKLQQQQQQQLQSEQQIPDTTVEPKEEETEPFKSESQSSITPNNVPGEEQSQAIETSSGLEEAQGQTDSKSQVHPPTTKGDKTALTGASKASNPQPQIPGNVKRMGPPIIPTPGLASGMQSPHRPPLAHPILHPHVVQQLHLQQLRMAQGGLLQPPFTPQQFALLQQIGQLQLVQQRLAAHSVAQQHIGQKHGQQVLPSQQQLYQQQQQQQIALMINQMQQQVLQQQPGLAGRHPALQFAAVHQQSLMQQQQQATAAQHKNSKPLAGDKTVNDNPQNNSNDTELVTGSSVPTEDHSQQPSPVPQSRLTQWKQPLLQDPSTVSQQSMTSNSSHSVDSNSQTASTSMQSSVSPSVVATIDVSESQGPDSSNSSPRTRISDPVSSKWGVDAGPKLSADPPEFKPGVPWRPAPKVEKKEERREAPSPAASSCISIPVSSNSEPASSDGWSTSSTAQNVTTSSNVPLTSAGKASGDSSNTTTTTNTGLSGATFNSTSAFPGQSQFDISLDSPSWQETGSMSYPQGAGKPARPPPGLGTDNALPESPLFDDKAPAWLESLIDVPSTNFNVQRERPQFPFSRFGFANSATPWSPRDGRFQPFVPLASNSQPWAAPGGPAPALASTTLPVSVTTNGTVASGAMNSISEPHKMQNPGIIWSANQPIPSAEEKLTGGLPVTSGPVITSSTGVASSRGNANPMSTWLVLCNLTPRTDPKALRSFCEKHGPLLTFQLNLRHGNSLIRYGSMEEAAKAQAVLNGLILNGTQVGADFATDADIGSFFEQTMDWGANPFPSNTYGNQWSFQNVLGSVANSNVVQAAPVRNPLPPSTGSEQPGGKIPPPVAVVQWGTPMGPMSVQGNCGGEQPGSKPNPATSRWGTGSQGSEQTGAKPTQGPGVQWGSGPGTVPLQSYLWGSAPSRQIVGGNFAQVPSMWSFPAGVPHEAESQSGSGENGLVSPSMTTFLPPGLLNGGGDSV